MAFFWAIGLSACSSVPYNDFHDAERPDSEVAAVEGSFRLYPFLLVNAATGEGFSRVDGELIPPGHKPRYTPKKLRLTPGRHRLEFRHGTFLVLAGMGGGGGGEILQSTCVLDMDFQAGRRYKIRAHTLEARSQGPSAANLYSGAMGLKISSPSSVERVTVPLTCARGVGHHFCKTDPECGEMLAMTKKPFLLFSGEVKKAPGKCALQAGYDYGVCVPALPAPATGMLK